MAISRKFLLTALLAHLASASAAFCGPLPGTGLSDSPHDLRLISDMEGDDAWRACAFCHTPHHAENVPDDEGEPLWSRTHGGAPSAWRSYSSSTLQANIIDPLLGPSRLCLSCHDGVVASDGHNGTPGAKAAPGGDGWGGRDIGKNADLSNDHPVGFSYREAQMNDAGGGLFPAEGRTFIGNRNNPSLTVKDVLWKGEFMTCTTCHDVHNRNNASHIKAQGRNYLVYAPQDGSALCLSCHNKGDG